MGNMELGPDIIDGIYIAKNDKVFSDSEYLSLLKDVFETATGRINTQESKLYSANSDKKSAFTSVLSAVLEAAKHDADPPIISSLCEECQMSSERSTPFINLYQENKEKIQLQLSLIGKNFDHIIDVNWRQDYIIKSNNCEKICEPSYVITLKTWNTQANSENDITFGCTLEQLQDLVLKLKDATKCIEKYSTN